MRSLCQSLRPARERSLSLPDEKLLPLSLLVNTDGFSARLGVDGREFAAVSLATRVFPVDDVDLFFLRRSLELAVLPRRVRSDVGYSSKSGVGVLLRDDVLEWDIELIEPGCRCFESLAECRCGWVFSISIPFAFTLLVLFHPRHPVHHSQPPSCLAILICCWRRLCLRCARRSFSFSQYSDLYISQFSRKSGENGFGRSNNLM